jgi:hypothetical protein
MGEIDWGLKFSSIAGTLHTCSLSQNSVLTYLAKIYRTNIRQNFKLNQDFTPSFKAGSSTRHDE